MKEIFIKTAARCFFGPSRPRAGKGFGGSRRRRVARVRAAPVEWGKSRREAIRRARRLAFDRFAARRRPRRSPGARGISPHISYGWRFAAAPQNNKELPLPGDRPAAGRCAACPRAETSTGTLLPLFSVSSVSSVVESCCRSMAPGVAKGLGVTYHRGVDVFQWTTPARGDYGDGGG